MTGVMWYLLVGIAYMYLEHSTLEFNSDELSDKDKKIAVLQLIVHYGRVVLSWPFYLVEDFLIYISDSEYGEE